MSGFLRTVARRALGLEATVRPRLPAFFEGDAGALAEVTEAVETGASAAPGPAGAVAVVDRPAPSPGPPAAVRGRTEDGVASPAGPVDRLPRHGAEPVGALPPAAPPDRSVRTAATARELGAVRIVGVERLETLREVVAAVPGPVRDRLLRADPALAQPAGARAPGGRGDLVTDAVATRRSRTWPTDTPPRRAARGPGAKAAAEPVAHDGVGGGDTIVEVTIGRVELRAAAGPEPAPRRAAPLAAPRPDLEAYLRDRGRS